MKKRLLKLVVCQILLFSSLSLFSQTLTPFENCPGVSVAVTRPGFNATLGPHQIYLIDTAGTTQATGNPINLQINGFGLNTADGFLYGMYQAFNIVNPFLTRVDRNGNYEAVGTLKGPDAGQFKTSVVNTAAGTMDDRDNYYFTAAVFDLQNVLLPPELYVGKVQKVSLLTKSDSDKVLAVTYTRIDPGTCSDELSAALMNPLEGALQDIAWNPLNGNIYTYIPAPGTNPTPGKMAWFNPNVSNPVFTCFDPAQPNTPTHDLSGLYFGEDSMLYILTIDGKYYRGNVQTGVIDLVSQTTMPLLNGNLRGDMASCTGNAQLVAFTDCPGVSVAVTRPGNNRTVAPYHIYTITNTGAIQPTGNPISQQINAFGLNAKDGFLYGMHESINVFKPWLSRVDKNGTVVDLGRLSPPNPSGPSVGIINTAAATMDHNDNYYFTAVALDTSVLTTFLPKLYLGKIENVSLIKPGDNISIQYTQILIGTCAPEIVKVIREPEKGLLQDLSFNPVNGIIYTVIPTDGVSPIPAKIGWFDPGAVVPVLNCINPPQPNVPIHDLSGLYSDSTGTLYILTTDGKFYSGDVSTGVISQVSQTTLPLLGNNLRGDMASCVGASPITGRQGVSADLVRVVPNPARGNQVVLSVHSDENVRVQVQIMDARGNRMQSVTISLAPGPNQFRLNVSGLQQGFHSAIVLYPSGRRTIVKFLKL